MHVVFGHVFHILRLLFVAKRVPAPFGGLVELVFQPHETVGAWHGRSQQAGQFVQCLLLAHVGCIEDGVILDKLVLRADDADGVAVGKVDGNLVSRLRVECGDASELVVVVHMPARQYAGDGDEDVACFHFVSSSSSARRQSSRSA